MSKSTNPSNKKKWVAPVTFTLFAIGVSILGLAYYRYFHNYAQDAALPIEQELIKGGAVKKCFIADPGRGPDNSTPVYEGRYEFAGSMQDAVKLINKAASDNGYKLTYQSSPYSYVGWYSDTIGKKVTFPGFENEHATISFEVFGHGGTLSCDQNDKAVRIDEMHTGISMGVGLPSTIRR